MATGLTGPQLQALMADENEKNYLVVDVRQPEEYRLDHIPGSVNIPLAEIQFDPYSFDDNRKLIFCCTRGSRSKVAAIFVMDAGYDTDMIYHLQSGMFEYSGELLLEMPRIDLFPEDMSMESVMKTAINFEKGAFRFYSLAKNKTAGTEVYKVLSKMAKDEVAHAKAVFNRMSDQKPSGDAFDTYFKTCSGNFLEGGKPFKLVQDYLQKSSSNPCMDVLDFAVELEYCAYDLYKTMAENVGEKPLENMFYSLAQAEKKHMEQVIAALELCVRS